MRELGRGGRSLLAVAALLGNSAIAVIGLMFICCGGLDLAHNVQSPFVWGALCGAAVAGLVLPDVADAVRRSRVRWLVVPLVAGTVCFLVPATAAAGEYGVWLWLVIVSTSVCALYAVVRLLLWRRP